MNWWRAELGGRLPTRGSSVVDRADPHVPHVGRVVAFPVSTRTPQPEPLRQLPRLSAILASTLDWTRKIAYAFPVCPDVTERNHAATFAHRYAPSWRGRMRSLQPMRDTEDTRLPAHEELTRLLTEIKSGSERALDCLKNACWGRFVRYVAWHLRDEDRHLAEDIVSEALLAVWYNRRPWEPGPPGSARRYLYRIVRNKMLDATRKLERRRPLWDKRGRWEAYDWFPRAPTPHQELVAKEDSDRLRRAVASLPARQREAFTLVYIEGLTYAETAEVMNISVNTVRKQLRAARRKLRRALGRT